MLVLVRTNTVCDYVVRYVIFDIGVHRAYKFLCVYFRGSLFRSSVYKLICLCVFQECVQKQEQQLKEQKSYQVAVEEYTDWQDDKVQKLQEADNTTGDWNAVESRIQIVKVTLSQRIYLS